MRRLLHSTWHITHHNITLSFGSASYPHHGQLLGELGPTLKPRNTRQCSLLHCPCNTPENTGTPPPDSRKQPPGRLEGTPLLCTTSCISDKPSSLHTLPRKPHPQSNPSAGNTLQCCLLAPEARAAGLELNPHCDCCRCCTDLHCCDSATAPASAAAPLTQHWPVLLQHRRCNDLRCC